MITPTVGRVVWYHPDQRDRLGITSLVINDASQPCAAHIAYVWSPRLVNLLVIDHDGNSHSRRSVVLNQGDRFDIDASPYCEWMPYQKGQAAKTEALEQKLAG